MDPEQILAVLARQMPDAEKRRRADRVVRTGLSRHHALRAIRRLINELRGCPSQLDCKAWTVPS
jgi:dephospho-CoA kinase